MTRNTTAQRAKKAWRPRYVPTLAEFENAVRAVRLKMQTAERPQSDAPMDPRPKWYEPTPDLLAVVPEHKRDELAALIREQARDARTKRVQWGRSLESLSEWLDGSSRDFIPLGAVCFDRDEDQWAYLAVRGKRRVHA